MKATQQNWYLRRDNKVMGPWPAGLVSRYVLLGRIQEDDLLSCDRETWHPLSELPELVPSVLREAEADPHDPEVQARLEAARRWADERRDPRPHVSQTSERRKEEALEDVTLRELRLERVSGRERRPLSDYLVVGTLLLVVVGTPFLLPDREQKTVPQCSAPAAPGVDWSNCLMPASQLANADLAGARLNSTNLSASVLRAANLRQTDLAYANLNLAKLRGANLAQSQMKGANLRGAELVSADLRGADLSYAILTGANLEGADLSGAVLDHAEWVDGSQCLPGSVGECLRGRPQ